MAGKDRKNDYICRVIECRCETASIDKIFKKTGVGLCEKTGAFWCRREAERLILSVLGLNRYAVDVCRAIGEYLERDCEGFSSVHCEDVVLHAC